MNIDVRISSERLEKFVTLDEMIALQSGSLEAIRNIIPRFMWDAATGDFFPVIVDETPDGFTVIKSDPTAMRLIGSLTFERLKQVTEQFKDVANKVAVDPQKAAP